MSKPISNGTRIKFRRADGEIHEDVVRGEIFPQDVLLAPYAPNETRAAVVLTNHSWCFVADIVEVE